MILIADSGSTKTTWNFIEEKNVVKQITTKGINPFYQSTEEIANDLEESLVPFIQSFSPDRIHFYGAGCSFPEKKEIVALALHKHFKTGAKEIESDLLGAARGLFGTESGIACILGTGSNSGYYNGHDITHNVSPLGYILGDEGSGAVLGKLFIADYLKNQLPQNITNRFQEKYQYSNAFILDQVYKKPFPNRFLAQFCPFILEHLSTPEISKIVENSFEAFFSRNVLQYPLNNVKVGFIGSVAFFFKDIVIQAARKHHIAIHEICKEPMSGLIKYHSNIAI